jgi:hypothetical protein
MTNETKCLFLIFIVLIFILGWALGFMMCGNWLGRHITKGLPIVIDDKVYISRLTEPPQ